jgi:CheY-like chemotaxis protein
MPDGGTMTFSSSRVRHQDAPVHEGDFACEYYVCLRVSDTGCGMDEATRLRIFEPFFTTKPRGKGTGLGMPVVYGLMQSHNGFVDVTSAPGQGTSVALYFPEPPEPAAPLSPLQQPVAEPAVAKMDGTETILIVDDEPDVRGLLEIILHAHGYKVLAASSAATALEMITRHPGQIRLLFSDVGLPGLDGFQLCAQARQLQPDIRTVLCSGFADGSQKARMAAEGIDGFIAKPYETRALLQVIRSVLD